MLAVRRRSVCTDGSQCVVQLQGEGSEGNLVRHGQDGDCGEVGGRVPHIPLTARGVEGQTTSWRGEKTHINKYEQKTN